MMLVLHHIDDLSAALLEVHRILKPGGRCIIVDMVEHDRSDYRHRMGHRHLGFSEGQLTDLCQPAGLRLAHFSVLPADPRAQGPDLFLATVEHASIR